MYTDDGVAGSVGFFTVPKRGVFCMQYYFRSAAEFSRNFAFIVNADIKPHFLNTSIVQLHIPP
jgi:hypothetical protein